jgi:hypothetical protein
MNEKEQTTMEKLLGGKTIEEVVKIQVEEKTAEWLTANLKTTDETDISTSAQRALFSRGVYDALAGRTDYALSQVVTEYFHGTDFARKLQNILKEETIKRYPTKTEHHEGWPEIRGKLVENKAIGD